jgi:transposase
MEGFLLEAILERCCGLDVHRDTVVACLLTGTLDERPQKEIRTFSTMSKGLHELLGWLQEAECTHVAMESTGVYWKPVYHVLEGSFELKLANAQRIKNVPGRKTDISDAEWLAKLLRSGLIEGSFVPPHEIRELRELTRYRKKLVGNATAEKNRVQKLLESSGMKLSSVISDVFGVTGRSLLDQLMNNGYLDEETIRSLVKGQIKKKVPQLVDALQGKLSSHQRFLLKQSWEHLMYLERSLEQIDEAINEHLQAYRVEMELLQTIPGIDQTAASAILAEIGADMLHFHSERHLASWAGLSPGNNESAGKKSPLVRHMETHT